MIFSQVWEVFQARAAGSPVAGQQRHRLQVQEEVGRQATRQGGPRGIRAGLSDHGQILIDHIIKFPKVLHSIEPTISFLAQVSRRAWSLRPAPDEPARDRRGQGGRPPVAAQLHRVPGRQFKSLFV